MDSDDHGLDADTLRLVTEHLDASYYAARYDDIRAAGCDAALHYATTGWRERRRPNAWFDTAYYLDSNRDVAEAQVNPLWHYLVRGQGEGRAPMRPAALQRDQLDRARPAAEQGAHYAAPIDAAMLDQAALLHCLARACLGAHGLVLSASHDRYTGNIGGTQLLVADEQAKFNGARMAYLHLSPAVARMTLAPPAAEVVLQLVLDGAMLGLANYDVIAAALAKLDLPDAAARILVVHCLLGHDERGLAQAAAALRTTTNLFWVHDYSSLCEGLHLLRNGVANCGAPPPANMACRVCVHGDSRAAHRERLLWLFGTLAFHVVAPSQAALDLWRHGADLPHLSARVHAHCRLLPGTRPARTDSAIRVAFVGFAASHKGWPLFERLLEATGGNGVYRYYHFASLEHLITRAWLTPIPVRVTPEHRLAMIRPLTEHSIDIALVLSPWAETFSFVAHEAMAAGAAVVAMAGSGNIAALVRATGRSVVLESDDALLELFTGDGARALADTAWPDPTPVGGLVHCGTSATLDLGADMATLEAMVTADPDLALIAGDDVILPTLDHGTYRFALPPGCQAGLLASRSCVPALMHPGAADHRRLGVAVTALALDGVAVPSDDPRRGAGWYPPERDWRWTDGRAALTLDGAAELSVAITPMLAYWRCPVAAPPVPEKIQHDLFGRSPLQSAHAADGGRA